MQEFFSKTLVLIIFSLPCHAYATDFFFPSSINCEAILLDKIQEMSHGVIRIHPSILLQWKESPSKAVVVKVRFKENRAWVGDVAANLKGVAAGLVPAEPNSRILSLDGWNAARMIRSLEEIQLAGEQGFDWMDSKETVLKYPAILQTAPLFMRLRALEAVREDDELIVIEIPLKYSAHEIFSIFRNAAAEYGALVVRPAFYSEPGNERLLIALPPSSASSRRFLQRLVMLKPNTDKPIFGEISFKMVSGKSLSHFAHEDTSWLFDVLDEPENRSSTLNTDDEVDPTSKRFSLIELDDTPREKMNTNIKDENDSLWIRFSLLELE